VARGRAARGPARAGHRPLSRLVRAGAPERGGADDATRGASAALVNFGEGFRYDYIRHFVERTDTAEHQWHSRRIMREIKDRLKEFMQQIIRALGSDGRA
jgi:hypothetical protein